MSLIVINANAQNSTEISDSAAFRDSLAGVFNNVKNFYENLDHSNMSTNLLLNYGFLILNDLEELNNGMPVISNELKFKYYYNSIDKSVISGNYGLPEDSLLDEQSDLNKYAASTVPLSVLYFEGDYLTADETKRLLKSDTLTPQYKTIDFFAATTLLNKVYDATVEYKYKPELLFSNKNDIAKLLINFEDGKGYKEISHQNEELITVNYNSIGEKSIRFKIITNDEDTLISYSSIEIVTLKNRVPDFKGIINDTTGFKLFTNPKGDPNVDLADANYNYYEGCDDKLDKAVIIAEGFDATGNMQTASGLYVDWKNTVERLNDHGYDVFTLNYNAPEQSLHTNAGIVKTLIKGINDEKEGNYEGTFIGESMSGLLGRIALKQLENENYDHQFGLYVSFDSPHKGANIPLGIQHIVDDIAYSLPGIVAAGYIADIFEQIFGWNVPYIDIYQTLNSSGAKQMIARHYNGYDMYNLTQSHLDDLGYPEQTRNVTFVNGSNIGNSLSGITLGDELLSKTIILGIYNLSAKAWYSKTNVNNQKVARTAIVKFIWPWWSPTPIPQFYYFTHRSSFDSKPFDNAPGSYMGVDIDIFNQDKGFTFVPALSAIDIKRDFFNTGSNWTSYFNENGTYNTQYLIDNDITPFDDIYSNDDNSEHVDNADFDFSNTLEPQEVMYNDMYLQNRTIHQNRDFGAKTSITAGRDVTNFSNYDYYHIKHIDIGDFIIESGTNVHFYAGEEINLEPGFETEDGAEFETFLDVDPCPEGKMNDDNDVAPEINGANILCGKATFTSNMKRENKVVWKLTGENANISSYGNEFTTPGTLPNGQYTLYCTAISDNNTATKTKTIQVKCTDEQQVIEKEKAVTDSVSMNNIAVYPNPNYGKFTILFENNKEKINAKISINDISGKTVYTKRNIEYSLLDVDISGLRNGLYILNITTDKQVITKKIIKQ